MEEKEFLDRIEEIVIKKFSEEFNEFEEIFFRRLKRKPNWNIREIKEEWLSSKNEYTNNKKLRKDWP